MIADISPEEFDAYFRLLWLFAFIILCLMGFLCYLYLSMHRASEREAQSRTFSWLLTAAQEEERRRISCELHDTVLPEIRRLTGPGGEAAAPDLIIRQQETLSARIREICFNLMPPDFTRLSLRDSLAGLCLNFTKRTGIECVPALEEHLDFSGKSPEQQLHLYRMVQEAFTNIEKHAGAERVVLVARRRQQPGSGAQSILICLSDDGRGLLPGGDPSSSSPGLGLRSMRERAAILGARLDFISENGNGFMVRIEIPINRPSRRNFTTNTNRR
jgi:two-component system NarL family sensor kinase